MITEVGIGFLFFWRSHQAVAMIENHYKTLNQCILNRDPAGIMNIAKVSLDSGCTVYTPHNIVSGIDYFLRISNQMSSTVDVLSAETKIKDVSENGSQIRLKVFYSRQLKTKNSYGDSRLMLTESRRLTQETWHLAANQWKLVELKVLKRETFVDGIPI